MSNLPSAKVYLERGNTKIALEIQKIDEAIANNFLKIVLPKVGEAAQAAGVNEVKFKDLKRIEFSYTLEGFVRLQQSDDPNGDFYDAKVQYDGANTRLTAAQAKNALIYKIEYGSGVANFYWGGLAKSDAKPTSAVVDLMESDDEQRSTNVAITLMKFEESGRARTYFKYQQIDNYEVDTIEFSPKRYGFTIRMVKGISFK